MENEETDLIALYLDYDEAHVLLRLLTKGELNSAEMRELISLSKRLEVAIENYE